MRRDTIETLLCGGDWIKEAYGIRSDKEGNDDPVELEFEKEYEMKEKKKCHDSNIEEALIGDGGSDRRRRFLPARVRFQLFCVQSMESFTQLLCAVESNIQLVCVIESNRLCSCCEDQSIEAVVMAIYKCLQEPVGPNNCSEILFIEATGGKNQ
ncbi:hypothetical protein Leryth_024840 [Lithospermum erythrorhizon]|nr:hypothetical protein Leryth_024840 [Lithospermum erythrorhizon]